MTWYRKIAVMRSRDRHPRAVQEEMNVLQKKNKSQNDGIKSTLWREEVRKMNLSFWTGETRKIEFSRKRRWELAWIKKKTKENVPMFWSEIHRWTLREKRAEFWRAKDLGKQHFRDSSSEGTRKWILKGFGLVKYTKSAGRMPWQWEPMKDAVSCEKLWGAANRPWSADIWMGKPIRADLVYRAANT